MTIGTKKCEEEMGSIKVMLEKLTKKREKNKCASIFKTRRSPS